MIRCSDNLLSLSFSKTNRQIEGQNMPSMHEQHEMADTGPVHC